MRQRRQPNVIVPEPLPATPASVPIKWSAESAPFQTNDVVQAVSGPHRGFIGIIGHIENGTLWTYHIVPNQGGMGKVELESNDCVVIGKAKVASRNPFPSQPVAHPAADVKYDPDNSLES